MKLYALRHGQSTYNVDKRINQDFRIKVALTDKGKKQTEKISYELRNMKFDVIFASEFFRTQQTAKIINKFHNAKIIVDARINETRVGFEGQLDIERRKKIEGNPFKVVLTSK